MKIKEEKNQQILEAAALEFLKKGFEGASMHNISESAEVSKRTLYKYYPDKESLFDSLVEIILQQIEGYLTYDFSEEVSIEKQITTIIKNKLSLLTNQKFLLVSKITIGEMMKGKKPSQRQLERLYLAEESFLKWIEAQQTNKNLKPKWKAQNISEQFNSFIKGLVYWPLIMELKTINEIDMELVFHECLDFFIERFVVDENKKREA